MKQTHKQKVKLARRLITSNEVIKKVNLFDSDAWEKRREAKAKKVLKRKNKKNA